MKFSEYSKKIGLGAELKDITVTVLQLEETLIETLDTEKAMKEFGDLFSVLYRYSNAKNIEVDKTNVLEYWKMNTQFYPLTPDKLTTTVYLYGLRTCLNNLYKGENEDSFLFDMILKTMLFITYLGWSTDIILNNSLPVIEQAGSELEIPTPKKRKKA